MKVLIGTPTAGGIATTAFTQSVVAATIAIHEQDGSYTFVCIDGADVIMARNLLAHHFLSDKSLTHILFIDNDMLIELGVFRHFLSADVPMLGAAYSERRMDMAIFGAGMAEHGNEERARALASHFNVHVIPGEIEVSKNVCKVRALGFGCVLIKRSVFEALIEQNEVRSYISRTVKNMGLKGIVYDFFDKIQLESGDWLSEDYAFCHRVTSLGYVDVNAYVGGGVGHVGQFTYSGPYIERLKVGKV